jgi:murein L,D-transpeptidase YafK
MKPFYLFAFLISLFVVSIQSSNPTDRVAAAYKERWGEASAKLKAAGINPNAAFDVHFRTYKQEMEVEVWAKQRSASTWAKVGSYPVCAYSGILGPKRYDGDCQVPEGLYTIHHLIPQSTFHLSMYVSYPNASDKIRGDQGFLGKDICIHGDCTSVGCLSLLDEIKEVYIYADKAIKNGQRDIPLHMFPMHMDKMDVAAEIAKNKAYTAHKDVWTELKEADRLFLANKKIPAFTINPTTGAYTF